MRLGQASFRILFQVVSNSNAMKSTLSCLHSIHSCVRSLNKKNVLPCVSNSAASCHTAAQALDNDERAPRGLCWEVSSPRNCCRVASMSGVRWDWRSVCRGSGVDLSLRLAKLVVEVGVMGTPCFRFLFRRSTPTREYVHVKLALLQFRHAGWLRQHEI